MYCVDFAENALLASFGVAENALLASFGVIC